MHSLIGSIGPGISVVFLAVLWLGTKGGGKAKSLGYGSTLVIALLAAGSMAAGPAPFNAIPSFFKDMFDMVHEVSPDLSMPAITLITLAFLVWCKVSTRQVAFIGFALFYCAASSEGTVGTIAGMIAHVTTRLAA